MVKLLHLCLMRKERKNSVKEAIIDTASQLFYKQGYGHTGINQIIEESGVVKSSMYAAFSSKEDILMAYLVSAGARTDEALKAASDKFKKPKDKVLAVFDFLIGLVQQKEYYGCTFLNIISEMPMSEEPSRITSQIRQQKNGVRRLFKHILRPVGREKLADDLYTLFEGALIANKVHNEVWPIQRAKNMAELLLK